MAHPPADAHPAVAPHGTDAAHGAAAQGGEHAAATFPPFDTTLFASQLIWFAVTFLALYVILSRIVLPHIAEVLAKRDGVIRSDLDEAAKKGAAAEQARIDMESATAKARAQARAMIDAARADVTAKLAAEQEQAEARLAERLQAAEARVEAARQKALADVPTIADTLAREIADRLAPGAAQPARQRAAGDA